MADIVADIRKIGGDQAVAIATALAAEKSIVKPEDGPTGDKLNIKGAENEKRNTAFNALSDQLRTIMNTGIVKAAKIDEDGVATFDDATKAAIRDLNPNAVKLATTAGANPNNSDALIHLADAIVNNGVLKHLDDIPTSALQSPTASPAAAPTGPTGPTK